MRNLELKKLSDEMLENVVGGMETPDQLSTEKTAYDRMSTLNFYGACVGMGFAAVNGFKSLACYARAEFTSNPKERHILKEKSWNSGLKAIGILAGTYAVNYEVDKRLRQRYHIDPPSDY